MKNKEIYGICLFVMIVFSLVFSNSCKKENANPSGFETDSISDIDGNVYKTVKIGNQWWTAENLKTKRFRNGDSITFVNEINYNLDSTKWHDIYTSSYCLNGFGFLYNFYTINDQRNIAPIGWHIPGDDEWKELEKYLGMNEDDADRVNWRGSNEGNKLKNQKGWNNSLNTIELWGTNESGFSAIASSCRMFTGDWGSDGTGFWWTSSVKEDQAWYRYLDINKANIFRYYGPKNYGFSIRCVKDKN